jgi:hypothetical protein
VSITLRPHWRIVCATLAAIISIGSLTGCNVRYNEIDRIETPAPNAPEDIKDAAAALTKLTVAKSGSMRGYSRDRFPHWRSTGDNCDVRDSVLKRDGSKIEVSGCNVTAGRWISAYDGKVITNPAAVDIDHLVPLANAWRSGASAWTDDKRADFANDLDEPQLIAVSATSNRSKGDQDPSTWKPTKPKSWCQYAEDWIAVKSHWKLTVTEKEKAELNGMLESCT